VSTINFELISFYKSIDIVAAFKIIVNFRKNDTCNQYYLYCILITLFNYVYILSILNSLVNNIEDNYTLPDQLVHS